MSTSKRKLLLGVAAAAIVAPYAARAQTDLFGNTANMAGANKTFTGLNIGASGVPVVDTATLFQNVPGVAGQVIGTMSASNSPTSWSIIGGNSPSYFTINTNTGVISFVATNVAVAGSYSLTVQASNASGSGNGTANITLAAWPNAATTGSSGNLTNSGVTSITSSGTYTNLNFNNLGTSGFLNINVTGGTVTLTNCTITSGTGITVAAVIVGGSGSHITFQNCTITGAGTSQTQVGTYGIELSGDNVYLIDSCNISGFGTCCEIINGQITIQNCWFHDLGSGPGTHYECTYSGGNGGADFSLLIQHNFFNNNTQNTATIYNENENAGNAAGLHGITIYNNKLLNNPNGSYTLYIEGNQTTEPISNVQINNNFLGIGGLGGYMIINPGSASSFTNVHVNNNWDYSTFAVLPTYNYT